MISDMINFKNSHGVRSDVNVKYYTIIQELVYTNEILLGHYKIYEWLIARKGIDDPGIIQDRSYLLGKYLKSIKYIVHDVKCTVDQIISIASLMMETETFVDSIGELMKKKDRYRELFQCFAEHKEFRDY